MSHCKNFVRNNLWNHENNFAPQIALCKYMRNHKNLNWKNSCNLQFVPKIATFLFYLFIILCFFICLFVCFSSPLSMNRLQNAMADIWNLINCSQTQGIHEFHVAFTHLSVPEGRTGRRRLGLTVIIRRVMLIYTDLYTYIDLYVQIYTWSDKIHKVIGKSVD